MEHDTKPCPTCKTRPRVTSTGYCRECWNARMRAYRAANGSPPKNPQVRCSRCKGPRTGKHKGYCPPCFAAWRAEKSTKCCRCGRSRAPGEGTQFSYCPRCQRDVWLQRNYGITVDQFDDRLARQGGRCAICRGGDNGRQWHVDHDHVTGAVRGVLCDKCNRGLGHFNETAALLRRAAEYLEANASH